MEGCTAAAEGEPSLCSSSASVDCARAEDIVWVEGGAGEGRGEGDADEGDTGKGEGRTNHAGGEHVSQASMPDRGMNRSASERGGRGRQRGDKGDKGRNKGDAGGDG